MSSSPIAELDQRELIAQVSSREDLDRHLNSVSRTLYCGFDPTAESLHIGNLVPLLMLRRFQLYGHRPIALVGGATGLIGDPSFKKNERALTDRDVVETWVRAISEQVRRFVDTTGNNAAMVVDNLDWTRGLDVITFLRDIGKHFSVNAMMAKDSVRSRLTQHDVGISFTEFSYMLLQSLDYAELCRRYGCTLQIGGNDQWGNITAGMDLVRRTLGRETFALTVPLVTQADGTKFGKTESGTIWLDSARTSPYSFYQFWLNTADADCIRYLKSFTFLDLEEIRALAAALAGSPELREAQRRLAEEVTRIVHGDEGVRSAQRISAALFDGAIGDLMKADLEQLGLDGIPSTSIGNSERTLIAILGETPLAASRSAARRLVESGGIQVNGRLVREVGAVLTRSDALFNRYHLIRRGKKAWHLVVEE